MLYFQPPVCDVFPNYEVVLFQPQTLNPPHLGSCRLTLHFNLALPPHRFLLSFLDHSFLPCYYRLPIRSRSSSKTSRFTRFRSPLQVWSASHIGISLTRHPPASAARPCAPRCVPASSAVPVPVQYPLCRPRPAPSSLSSSGGFTHRRSLCVSVSLPHPPWVLLLITASSGPWYRYRVDFREKARG